MESIQILFSIAAIIFALYYFFTWTFDFWKSRGVSGPQPIPGFGNFKDLILGREILSEYMMKLYKDYKDEPIIGIFNTKTPILIIKDLDLIKDVLIRDFSMFADRDLTIHEQAEPLPQNLFFLESKRWRLLRNKLTPLFTSHKLKGMFILMSECSDHLVNYIEKVASKNEPIDCEELMAKYTIDVIGNCIFGIEINAVSNEDSEFYRIGKSISHPSWTDILRSKIKSFSPRLYDILGYIVPVPEITKFFIRLVMDTINYRERNNIVRHDFIDILREWKKESDKVGDFDFTDSMITSQAFIFFAAGFETSSMTMTNMLYELALNPKIQDKLREEIDQTCAKYDGDLKYENMKEMDYLDKVFKETLRKYPSAAIFTRVATSSYTFDNSKVTIPKNQTVWIPIHAIHRDPSVYPKPDVFDPERFNEEAVQSRHEMSYIPFSCGPRNCIGYRFAIYQSKLGLIKILRNYKVESCEKTQIPYILDDTNFVLTSKSGIYLKIIKINRA